TSVSGSGAGELGGVAPAEAPDRGNGAGGSGIDAVPAAGSGNAATPRSATPVTSTPSAPTTASEPEYQLDIQLVDRQGKPQSGVRCELQLPDGTSRSGGSAGDGYIRISGLAGPGEATMALPDIDAALKAEGHGGT